MIMKLSSLQVFLIFISGLGIMVAARNVAGGVISAFVAGALLYLTYLFGRRLVMLRQSVRV